jgi:MYXO-CTERM domain-containing protein
MGNYGVGTWAGVPVTDPGAAPQSFANPACLYFDGVNDVVDIANSPELENIQEANYSYAAWFRPDDVPVAGTNEGEYAIVAKTGYHMTLRFGRAGDGTGRFATEHWLTGNSWTGTGGPSNQPVPAWYHVAGTVDRTAGQGRLYVNGAQAGAWSFTANAVAREYGTATWKIGNASPGSAYGSWRWAAKGRIDEVRIYNYALSPDQVLVLSSGVPAPGNVTAVGEPDSIRVTWTAPAPTTVSYTYTLVRVGPGATRVTLATGLTTTEFLDVIAGGSTHTYEVTATSVAVSGAGVSNSATAGYQPPRLDDHEEGLVDRSCGCGVSGLPSAAWIGLASLVALLAGRRRIR